MRRLLCLIILFLAPLAAAADPPDARAQYAERRGLLEADAACGLFDPTVRGALQIGAAQARGALLRGGWSDARVGELERAAVAAARARQCNDARTLEAAGRARDSFRAWTRTPSLTLPGDEREWRVQRRPDPAGWLLVQDIAAPRRAAFGVRPGAVALVVPLPLGARAPARASLIVRDVTQTRAPNLSVPGRNARGLERGAPSLNAARRIHAQGRRIETTAGLRSVVFIFPPEVLTLLAGLDVRESAIVDLDGQRLLIEIGDFAAARAFLALAPAR